MSDKHAGDRIQTKVPWNQKQLLYQLCSNHPPSLMFHLIDNANNLIFWCRFLNKIEPWHIVYIMQQKQNTLTLTWLTDTNFLG